MKLLMAMASIAVTSCFSVSSLAATHPASATVLKALDEGARIVELGSESAQKRAICKLVKRYVDSNSIANRWMGDYKNLERDRDGARKFVAFLPSYMATKAFPEVKKIGGESGSYDVNPNATQRSDGNFNVPVTVRTSSRTYSGKAVVSSSNKIRDVEYLGFSGVSYVGRDVKKELDAFYRANTSTSLPLTKFVQTKSAERGFINCN